LQQNIGKCNLCCETVFCRDFVRLFLWQKKFLIKKILQNIISDLFSRTSMSTHPSNKSSLVKRDILLVCRSLSLSLSHTLFPNTHTRTHKRTHAQSHTLIKSYFRAAFYRFCVTNFFFHWKKVTKTNLAFVSTYVSFFSWFGMRN